ncbi:IclR family transcriptional regulator domain-containing protein, partial [Arenibaculum sp.]|uniref:IclR family transcriptional regulator domain-containing protein n=1 Tax=Arenibaculum sp. TaxID=2865862 RepID=UPI002E110709|nr:IclR family transcriptional regulator C-terminal domain-containing protein [Arenibaculum sp.]
RLGLAALGRLDAVQVAGEALVDLAEKTERTALLTVWGERGPTIVRWQRSSRSVVTSLALGSVLPVLNSATGHVFIAFLPRLLTRARIEEERARAAEEGRPVPMEEIEALIREVRRRRLARVEGNLIPGLRAVSAPILDHQGEAAAAVTVIGSQNGRPGEEETVVAQTAGIAAAASARLGFREKQA